MPDPQPTARHRRRLLSPGAATLAVLVLLTAVFGATRLLVGAPGGSSREPRATATAQPSVLLPAQVTELHKALQDLDTACSRGRPGATTQQAVERDTEVVVEFAKRYPNAVFPLDEETGRTLSVLLVARYTLRQCAPQLVARIDALLPSDLRSTPAPRATP